MPPATHHTEGPLGTRKEKESEWGQSFQWPNFAFSFSQAHTCVLHTPDTRQSSLAQTSRSHLVAMRGDKVLKLAKGFRGRAKNCVRVARERVEKALQYATRDRRAHKRDFRSGWVVQIGAGAREHGVSVF